MYWAYNLRIISIIAVVVLHASAGFVSGIEKTDQLYGSMSWWAGNVFDSITRWCVPVFIMVSGYFLLNSKDTLKVFYKKRLLRIFTPLIFWTTFFCAWVIAKLALSNQLDIALYTLVRGFITGQPYYHLWFLYMLPFLYLVAPYLKYVLDSCNKKTICIFIFLAFFIASLNVIFDNLVAYVGFSGGVDFFVNDFLLYIGYFILGGYLYRVDLKVNPVYGIAGICFSWLITIYGSYIFTYSYFYNYLSINTIVASICVFVLCMCFLDFNAVGVSKTLSGLSFGVYLLHPVYLELFALPLKSINMTYANEFFYIPLISIFAISASFSTVYLMSKNKWLKKCI